ncbi:MAG: UvrD-helicase domain-containing protein [Capsulimonadaceae bacterium]|nr:UvrD-helicase domain-containing protein [Capsulimonadaceae bacterium]
MDAHAQQIRRIAREWRSSIIENASCLCPAEEILAAAESAMGIARVVLPADDLLLAGAQAVLDRDAGMIWQSDRQAASARLFDAAHEFAHLVLHDESPHCAAGNELTDQIDPDGAPVAAMTRVDGYSAQQRREYEANLFAAELLLPIDDLRSRFFREGWNANAVARNTGLSMAFVRSQFAQAILAPCAPTSPAQEHAPPQVPEAPPLPAALDESQRRAAEWAGAPFLLGAGPGTGKTRTLVARCVHLVLERKVSAESILALTFSRKAAEEMRERLIASGIGGRRAGPWIGTFHSFGLELLRRYGHHVGLRPGWRLLDGQEAFHMLERNLGRLALSELEDINNPALHLRDILTAISRAKDELCGPVRYARLAERMTPDADTELKKARAANRTIETASVYATYQDLLKEANAIDFGDLIALPVRLLRLNPGVADEVHAQYPHILADEYQDVNRACARLIRLLAGPSGENLWLVGDHRQSIYRFRGASPANIAAFHKDYADGVKDELAINYRSRAEVVELFSAASTRMAASAQNAPAREAGWQSARGTAERDFPAVTYAVAETDEAQADGIADSIRALHKAGTAYANQAILCRTHYQAEILAHSLAERDIPAICAQNLLDRPESKDLLALLQALTAHPSSAIGLIRLALIPEIGMTPDDAITLARAIGRSDRSVVSALSDPEFASTFESTQGFATLRRMILALGDETDPALCLERFLFQESQYLRDRLGADGDQPVRDLPTLRSICTVRQFIELARVYEARTEQAEETGDADDATDELVTPNAQADQRIRFLDAVRRMIASGDTPTLDLSNEARSYDAVAMITAHAAKGLEFPVVFVPNLTQGRFPPRPRDPVIPEPPGMADTGGNGAFSDQGEEECLFFVAISRAREHLILSRCEAGGEHNARLSASPLLSFIEEDLHRLGVRETRWAAKTTSSTPLASEAEENIPNLPARASYTSHQLNVYLRCPRQYYYAVHAQLGSTRQLTPGEVFSRAINDSLTWLRREWKAGRSPGIEDLSAHYDEQARGHGEMPAPYDELFAGRAREMLEAAQQAWATDKLRPVDRSDKLIARLDGADVRAAADLVAYDDAGQLVIARHILGRPQDDDHTSPHLALLRRAADDTAPSRNARIELRYLQTGAKRVVARSPKWEPGRVKKYDDAAAGIARSEFPARPNEARLCARCPYLFTCPA